MISDIFGKSDDFNGLTSKYAARRFVAILSAVQIFCVVLYFSALRFMNPLFEGVLINIFSSNLTILILYVTYAFFIGLTPPTRIVRPQEINELVNNLSKKTSIYLFWGRSGSHFSSVTLQNLDRQARQTGIDVELLLPDPQDVRLANSYHAIVTTLGESSPVDILTIKVIATAIKTAWYTSKNKYLRAKIYYSKFLPAFRIDLGADGAILTQDDPLKQALYFDSKSEFYNMFKATIRNEMDSSEEIEYDNNLFLNRTLEEAVYAESLLRFGATQAQVNDAHFVARVKDLLLYGQHRY